MREKTNYKIIALSTVAILFMLLIAPLTGFFGYQRAALNLAILGTFVCFIMVLEMKQERILKGIFLIGFGVLFQLIYPKYLFAFVDKALTPQDSLEHFEVIGQVILLACSGAGGSIIAVHADKSSSDNEASLTDNTIEKSTIEKIVLDNTAHIENLIKTTTQSNKKINILTAITTLSVIVTVAMLIATLTR